MTIHNRWLATLIIGVLWVLTSIAVVATIPFAYNFGFGLLMMLMIGGVAFAIASVITYVILTAYDSGRPQPEVSRRSRVEKVLRELDDRDLEALRERLMYDRADDTGTDGEYESLEALLTKQKRQ